MDLVTDVQGSFNTSLGEDRTFSQGTCSNSQASIEHQLLLSVHLEMNISVRLIAVLQDSFGVSFYRGRN